MIHVPGSEIGFLGPEVYNKAEMEPGNRYMGVVEVAVNRSIFLCQYRLDYGIDIHAQFDDEERRERLNFGSTPIRQLTPNVRWYLQNRV